MKTQAFLFCLASSVALMHCSAKVVPPDVQAGMGDPNDPRFASVLSYMQSQMEKHEIPGGSIAIVEDGRLAFSAGVGVKKENTKDPVLPSTLFNAGALSKVVVAATAMKLVEEGKLDPDKPVTTYAPLTLAQPFDPSTIAVRDLLTHTSGLPEITDPVAACNAAPATIPAWFASQPPQPLWTKPGAVFNYSNRGVALLGWTIESVSGQSFEDAATSRVLGPAGMSTATFDLATARAQDHAFAYEHDAQGNVTEIDLRQADCAPLRAASGVIASVIDYGHFAETMLAGGGTMLSQDSVMEMEAGHADTDQRPSAQRQYGYGLYVDDAYKGLRVVRHESTLFGYRASMWMVPDENFAVIVFYNATGGAPENVSKDALDVFFDAGNVAAPNTKTAPVTWAAYTGHYEDPYFFGPIDVTATGDSLFATAPNVGVYNLPLTQVSGDEFSGTFDGSTRDFVFYPGPNGPAGFLVSRYGVGTRAAQ